MEQFYVIVMTTVVVLLIVTLTYIGVYVINDDDKSVTFPPVETQCPDYWEAIQETEPANTDTGDAAYTYVKCKPVSDVNTGNRQASGEHAYTSDAVDFYSKKTKYKTICDKKNWANLNGISWDGVSNYNKC